MRRLLFGFDTPETARTLARQTNPCLQTFGLGPAGFTCQTCRHLIAKAFNKTYYKCALRGNTDSAATDHRVKWPACSRYEPMEEEQP